VLADAGVVDAGGRGVLAMLDELVGVITGAPAAQRPEFAVPAGFTLAAVQQADGPRWEVMYLLDGVTEPALPALRDTLSSLGDCVTIAGDGAGSRSPQAASDEGAPSSASEASSGACRCLASMYAAVGSGLAAPTEQTSRDSMVRAITTAISSSTV
jgi:hypothetical protein